VLGGQIDPGFCPSKHRIRRPRIALATVRACHFFAVRQSYLLRRGLFQGNFDGKCVIIISAYVLNLFFEFKCFTSCAPDLVEKLSRTAPTKRILLTIVSDDRDVILNMDRDQKIVVPRQMKTPASTMMIHDQGPHRQIE